MREGIVLTSMQSEQFSVLRQNPLVFWNGVKEIGKECFIDKQIKEIIITPPVKVLGEGCFTNCTNLQTVELPQTLKVISKSTFKHCTQLKSIVIPNSVKRIEEHAFDGCVNLQEIVLSNKIKELNYDTFSGCVSLKKIIIPKSVKKIAVGCFYYCTNLSYISIPSKTLIDTRAFCNNKFNYYYINKKEKRVYFSENLPEATQNISNILNLQVCRQAFYDFNQNLVNFVQDEYAHQIIEAANKLNKVGMALPYVLVRDMVHDGKFDEFFENSHFTFFNKEMPKELLQKINTYSENFLNDFYSFAISLGCFSKEKMLDSQGKQTNTFVYQKASTIFVQLNKLGAFDEMFDHTQAICGCDMYSEPNQDFLNFCSFKQGKDEYVNLKLLMEMNEVARNIFARIMPEFNNVSKFRTYVNSDGKPKTRSWKETLEKYLTQSSFRNVNSQNEDIAELFATKDLQQTHFDQAIKIRKVAKAANVSAHILGKELKEETILDSITKIKNNTEKLLQDSKVLIDELYEKQFTYEMLNKYDANNFVLGTYCSCCATINSVHYGKDITIASVCAEDVQNMVVRDVKGSIIAKCTLYVNKKYGYVVINDFEINSKYKKNELHDEDDCIISGYYSDEIDSPQRHERDLIFNTFMRGIKAFVSEYDKQNPNNPIRQVNVGLGHNRLQEQCEQFKVATSLLKVPSAYCFQDAQQMQCILYKKEEIGEINNTVENIK